MSSRTAEATNNVGGEITLFGAVVLAMTTVPTVLADLIFIVAQGPVESSQFTKLITFVVILAFGGRGGLNSAENISALDYVTLDSTLTLTVSMTLFIRLTHASTLS